MNKTGKRWICFLALLMCLCLLLTSCNPVPQQPAGNSEAQVENLAKLCKVWGYVKYTHPVFLLGEKDWDEELLKIIPTVSEADSDEVNGILTSGSLRLGRWTTVPSTASRSGPPPRRKRSACRLTPAGSVRTIWAKN